MKCRVRCQIFFGLVALLQFGCVFGKPAENDHAFMLQTKVENLIEKILQVIEDYYHQIRTELKCIPDEVPDTVIGTLKNAIDCVDQNERNYESGHITANVHKKAFLKCFSDAKAEVEQTITSIDPTLDYCPQNMTEKTYQINVTTTITKTFHINIKNGLEIIKKKLNLGNEEEMCVINQGHFGKPNQTVPHNVTENEINEDDSSSADENKVNDIPSKEHHDPLQPQGHQSKEHPNKGHQSKEHANKGHQLKEHPDKGHESKEHYDKEHQSKEHPNKGHQSKEHPNKGHQSKEHPDKGHETKEHYDKEHQSKEHPNKGHQSKEHSDKGHETKEHQGKEHVLTESSTPGHETKEHLGKGHVLTESSTPGHETKEHLGKGHVLTESSTPGHETKEHLGKGHVLTESSIPGHETKEHHGKGHVLTESSTQGHVSKEHHGKGQQTNESVLGTNDSVDEFGGNDSSNGNDVWYEPDLGTDDYNDNDENDSDQDNYFPPLELPGHGGASNDDDVDDDFEENDNEFSNADENDKESNSSGLNEDEDGGVSRPDLAQNNYEESEAKGHHTARPDSKGFHDKGHESKESYDTNLSSEHQSEDYEDDDNKNYFLTKDYDANDVYDDADYDEDINFLKEGKQNTVNSIADSAAHDIEIKNKVKDKNPFSGHDLTTDDGEHDVLGTGHEKLFFPGVTAKSKFTTLPPGKLALGSPTNKPFEQDYYADPDTEPEDYNYGLEYYDASENPEKSLDQTLGQSKPTPPVAERIQIEPKNQIEQKPKQPIQNTERHKIPLPKHWHKQEQKRHPSQSIISLSQTISQSDI